LASRAASQLEGAGTLPGVTSAEPVAVSPPGPSRYSAAQTRIINTAIDLFAQRGVGATSLQMIADAIGVTKAAVYHQFKTKDEIVLAVVEADMAQLESALDAAEAEDGPEALDVLLVRLVDLAVEHRRMLSMLQNDPVVVRLLAEHEPFRDLMDRLYRLLGGDGTSGDGRVPAAMLSTAIGSAAMHPLVADIDDETLRTSLLEIARRFLHVP
jgi:AcrR family transcriptional regulator